MTLAARAADRLSDHRIENLQSPLRRACGEPVREGVLRGSGVNEQELRKRLEQLRSEHRDLDVAIAALTDAGDRHGFVDQLQLARLKKRKLVLKDRIAAIEDVLLPDIIA